MFGGINTDSGTAGGTGTKWREVFAHGRGVSAETAKDEGSQQLSGLCPSASCNLSTFERNISHGDRCEAT